MFYYEVYLYGLPNIYMWSSKESIPLGARVEVVLRNRKKIGVVVGKTDKKPEFQTKDIQSVLDYEFLPEVYILLARKVAKENFCFVGKVFSLMLPQKYFEEIRPEKRLVYYELGVGEFDLTKIKGEKQKIAITVLQENKGVAFEEVLRESVPLATIKNLVNKGFLIEKVGEVALNDSFYILEKKNHALTDEQKNAINAISNSDIPVLLFGVTGSGKTEIYKKLVLETTGQSLILVPEIALTPQLISEFQQICGETVVVWHSKMSEGEKIQNFARILNGTARVLIGTRSACLVPMPNLKLIILDEEHEWTFKNEFTPRFLCHDLVSFLSLQNSAKLIFGSATPRLESFKNCDENIWKRVNLPNRVFATKLPKIELIDLKNETKKGNYEPISERLLEKMKEVLAQKKQAILFLNKRGFAGSTFCKACGFHFQCPNCSVNMKAHGTVNKKFLCHFCGHLEMFPKQDKCPTCGEAKFEFRGWGTQSVENYLKIHLPQARLVRADADTITKKKDFENLMRHFYEKKADILLGTQMIAKGLDFEDVELCGVILADVGLNLPDSRAEERVFQLLTQVAGRAGRRQKQGEILIQTFRPKDKIFEFLKEHDVEKFLQDQSLNRIKTQMPPFTVLAKITFSDEDKKVAFERTQTFYKFAKKNFVGSCNFAPAFFPKMYSRFHFHVFLRHPQKAVLVEFLEKLSFDDGVVIDVMPSSLL